MIQLGTQGDGLRGDGGTVCVNPNEKPRKKLRKTSTRNSSALKMELGTVFIPLLLQCNLDRNTVPSPKECRSFSAVCEKQQ